MGPACFHTGPPSLRDARELTAYTLRHTTRKRGKTASVEGFMHDSGLNEAERRLQPRFSLAGLVGGLLVAAIVLAVAWRWDEGPDRYAMPQRSVALTAVPIAIDPASVVPLRLVGAWRLTAPDPRFGGLSALAIDRGGLLAVSDNGVVFRFPRPGDGPPTVEIADLPDGPGSPASKTDRDSESLARDTRGRGWWIGFETSNQLWLYDRDLTHALGSLRFGRKRWPFNRGIEAMLAEPDRLEVVPELAHEVVFEAGSKAASEPLGGVGSDISDMVRLANGETIVLMRNLEVTGFRLGLGALVRTTAGWRVERRVPLDVGMFMNLEGIAAEPRADGGTRLWLVTDDNFQRPMTTALFALDVPPGRWRGRD